MFFSGQFALDVFWGMILSFFTAYMKVYFAASDQFISVVWMTSPLVGILVGSYAGSILSKLGSTRKTNRIWTVVILILSVGLLLALFLIFPKIRFWYPLETDKQITKARFVAAGIFLSLMVVITIVMTCFYSMVGYFMDTTISKTGLPMWGALGQMTVMLIIDKFLPGSFNDDGWVFNLFSVGSGLIGFFIFISIIAVLVKEIPEPKLEKIAYENIKSDSSVIDIIESSPTCCIPFVNFLITPFTSISTYFSEGGWYYALIIFFGWSAFFSIQPIANDWFATVIYEAVSYEPEYGIAITEASKLRFYQQLVQLSGAILLTFILIAIKKCLECMRDLKKNIFLISDNYYDLDLETAKHEQMLNVGVQVIYMAVFSAGVLMTGFSGAQQVGLATIGFALTGAGPVILFSAREFQRLFFRGVRNDTLRKFDDPKAISSKFPKRDLLYDAIVANFFIQLGQLFPFVLNQTLFGRIGGYPGLILLGGVFGCFSLLFTLFSFCPCIKSCYDEDSPDMHCCPCDPCCKKKVINEYQRIHARPRAEEFFGDTNKKMGTRVVFQTQRKAHHL